MTREAPRRRLSAAWANPIGPAPGFTESEAYYLPGMGAIARTYFVRNGDREPADR